MKVFKIYQVQNNGEDTLCEAHVSREIAEGIASTYGNNFYVVESECETFKNPVHEAIFITADSVADSLTGHELTGIDQNDNSFYFEGVWIDMEELTKEDGYSHGDCLVGQNLYTTPLNQRIQLEMYFEDLMWVQVQNNSRI